MSNQLLRFFAIITCVGISHLIAHAQEYKYVKVSNVSEIAESDTFILYDASTGVAMSNKMNPNDASFRPAAMKGRIPGAYAEANKYGTVYSLSDTVGLLNFLNMGNGQCQLKGLNFAEATTGEPMNASLTWSNSMLQVAATPTTFYYKWLDDGSFCMTRTTTNDAPALRYYYLGTASNYYWHIANGPTATSDYSAPNTYLLRRTLVTTPELPRVWVNNNPVAANDDVVMRGESMVAIYVEDAEQIYINGTVYAQGNECMMPAAGGSYEVWGVNKNGASSTFTFSISYPQYLYEPVVSVDALGADNEYIICALYNPENAEPSLFALTNSGTDVGKTLAGITDASGRLALLGDNVCHIKFESDNDYWKLRVVNADNNNWINKSSTTLKITDTPTQFNVSFDNGQMLLGVDGSQQVLKYSSISGTEKFVFSSVSNANYWPATLYRKCKPKKITALDEIDTADKAKCYTLAEKAHVVLTSTNYLLVEDYNNHPILLEMDTAQGKIITTSRGDKVSALTFTIDDSSSSRFYRGEMIGFGKVEGFESIPDILEVKSITEEHHGKIVQMQGSLVVTDQSTARFIPKDNEAVYYVVRNVFEVGNGDASNKSMKRYDAEGGVSWMYGDKWPDAGEYTDKSLAGVVMPTSSGTPEIWATTMTDGGTITDVDSITSEAISYRNRYFTLSGQEIAAPIAPGIYILRLGDGTVNKIMIK